MISSTKNIICELLHEGVNNFFVTHPSLQTAIFWYPLNPQNLFQSFNANITWVQRAKVLNKFFEQFFGALFFLVDLGQKESPAFNFSWWCFFDRTLFLIKYIDIFRNLNHCQVCKNEKDKFRTTVENKFIKHFKILVWVCFTTSKVAHDI